MPDRTCISLNKTFLKNHRGSNETQDIETQMLDDMHQYLQSMVKFKRKDIIIQWNKIQGVFSERQFLMNFLFLQDLQVTRKRVIRSHLSFTVKLESRKKSIFDPSTFGLVQL